MAPVSCSITFLGMYHKIIVDSHFYVFIQVIENYMGSVPKFYSGRFKKLEKTITLLQKSLQIIVSNSILVTDNFAIKKYPTTRAKLAKQRLKILLLRKILNSTLIHSNAFLITLVLWRYISYFD